MKIRIFAATTFILAAVAIPAGMAGCDEPQVQCQVGHATSFEYVMQYTVLQQSDGCKGAMSPLNSQFFSASQVDGRPIAVNHVALEDYHPSTGVNTRDVSQTTVYIETDDVQSIEEEVECYESDDPFVGYVGQQLQGTDQPWETASFVNQFPDANNMCQLTGITPATGISASFAAANPAPSCGPAAACVNVFNFGGAPYNMSCVCVGHCTGALTCVGDSGGKACKDEGAVCGKMQQGFCRATCDKDGTTCDPGAGAATTCSVQTENCCDTTDLTSGPMLTSCHTGAQTISEKSHYDWEDVQFYTTADAPGTQFSATLTYNVGACQATLAARGVWPSTDCTLTDASGTPTEADGKTPLAAGHHPFPNPAACCTNPDVDHDHASGSQINGNFNVHCDPDVLLCVLNGDATEGIPVLDTTGVPDTCPAEISVQ